MDLGHIAPLWERGQWWRYTVQVDSQVYNATLVVTEKRGTYYSIATDSKAFGSVAERYLLPFRFAVNATDLGGFEARNHIPENRTTRFFDWPLVGGKTWATRWNPLQGSYRSQDVTVAVEDVSKPDETRFNFLLRGSNDERLAQYAYAPSVGWFTKFSTLRQDMYEQAPQSISLELLSHGRDFSGGVFEVKMEGSQAFIGGLGWSRDYTVPPAASEFWIPYDGETTGSFVVRNDPPGDVERVHAVIDCPCHGEELVSADEPGKWTWRVDGQSVPPPGGWSEVRIGVYLRSFEKIEMSN